MLRAAGAPRIESELLDLVTLETGNFWHRRMADSMLEQGIPFMAEVKLHDYLPEGWSGYADYLIWEPEHDAFVLTDLKTNKGEGMRWIEKGAKEDHLWQVSAYWYACVELGLPMLNTFNILYLPKNSVPREDVSPVLHTCKPIPSSTIHPIMEDRYAKTREYLQSLGEILSPNAQSLGEYITEALAAPQERVQRLYWDAKRGIWNVVLTPHWSAAYCPYPNELCDCSEQKSEKVGHWTTDGEWIPRKGYDVEPTVKPDQAEVDKRLAS